MKTGEDFKKQALKHNISYWIMRNCSICDYPLKYVFENGEVYFDSSCNCTNFYNLQLRSWENVANYYNMQTDENVIKEMDSFWKFDEELPITKDFMDNKDLKEAILLVLQNNLDISTSNYNLNKTNWNGKEGNFEYALHYPSGKCEYYYNENVEEALNIIIKDNGKNY